jgi:hypothetical protein
VVLILFETVTTLVLVRFISNLRVGNYVKVLGLILCARLTLVEFQGSFQLCPLVAKGRLLEYQVGFVDFLIEVDCCLEAVLQRRCWNPAELFLRFRYV